MQAATSPHEGERAKDNNHETTKPQSVSNLTQTVAKLRRSLQEAEKFKRNGTEYVTVEAAVIETFLRETQTAHEALRSDATGKMLEKILENTQIIQKSLTGHMPPKHPAANQKT